MGQRLQGPELCGSENTLQLWCSQRKFLLWPQPVLLRCWSVGMLWLSVSLSPLPLSFCLLHIHLSISFRFSASSLVVPPSTGPSSDNHHQSFSSHYNPHLIFGVNLHPLITCLPCFLPLSHIFTPYTFFLACPHTHIIHFPSRRTSVPAQLPFSPHIVTKSFRAVLLR